MRFSLPVIFISMMIATFAMMLIAFLGQHLFIRIWSNLFSYDVSAPLASITIFSLPCLAGFSLYITMMFLAQKRDFAATTQQSIIVGTGAFLLAMLLIPAITYMNYWLTFLDTNFSPTTSIVEYYTYTIFHNGTLNVLSAFSLSALGVHHLRGDNRKPKEKFKPYSEPNNL